MKKAFTMLELVFVLIVIGILSVFLIPRFGDKPLYQATAELVSQIRYTQHLAMVDDKLDKNNNSWYKNRWQIQFDDNKTSIVSDNGATYAKNPLDSTDIHNIDFQTKYGVTIAPCYNSIAFDHLGRPIANQTGATSPYAGLLTSDCDITLSKGGESKTITLTPETGYVRVSD